MTNQRMQVTLPPDVIHLLDHMEPRGKSEYIARAVRDRWAEWTSALLAVRAAGWDDRDILAVCSALNGCQLDTSTLVYLCKKRLSNVSCQRMIEMLDELQRNPLLCVALIVVVREYCANNRVLRAELGMHT